MREIGEKLQQTRKASGISKERVENETKIPLKYIQAMEDGDFDKLPGQAYIIGFLRNYARYLNLDDDQIIAFYKEAQGINDYEDNPVLKKNYHLMVNRDTLADINRHPWPAWKVALVSSLSIICVFIVFLYYLGANQEKNLQDNNNQLDAVHNQISGSQTGSSLPPKDSDSGSSNNAPPAKNPGQTNPVSDEKNQANNNQNDLPANKPLVSGLEINILADKGPCWMQIDTSQESRAYDLKRGEEITVKDDQEIKIRYGSAGAVQVRVNGITQEALGDIGDIVEKTYAVDL